MLWFDTEDYIDPASDDAALRIANDLSSMRVQATFKIVGEKARVLEARHRTDVIAALSKHAIGFHSNWHSLHPTPAEYLRMFGYLEGADEFERREGPGAADIKRIFGVTPTCYGQPGVSWGPQANLALRRMGIPVYLDEGEQVGLNEQPFWYGGLLYVFHMGSNEFRAELNAGAEDQSAYKRFDQTVEKLQSDGGGVISMYYHPTEFIHTEFWDAVNFSRGAMPPRDAWILPKRRSPEDAERCFGVLHKFVEHMKQTPNVEFLTARDVLTIYDGQVPARIDTRVVGEHLNRGITFLDTGSVSLSPADMVLQLLHVNDQVVDGPTQAGSTTVKNEVIDRQLFERTKRDVADFIQRNHRLPSEVFVGAQTLSLADFTATLAQDTLDPASNVRVTQGQIKFDRHFATDPKGSFKWPIHPADFSAPELLELARLQGWTLKPAKLRK